MKSPLPIFSAAIFVTARIKVSTLTMLDFKYCLTWLSTYGLAMPLSRVLRKSCWTNKDHIWCHQTGWMLLITFGRTSRRRITKCYVVSWESWAIDVNWRHKSEAFPFSRWACKNLTKVSRVNHSIVSNTFLRRRSGDIQHTPYNFTVTVTCCSAIIDLVCQTHKTCSVLLSRVVNYSSNFKVLSQ